MQSTRLFTQSRPDRWRFRKSDQPAKREQLGDVSRSDRVVEGPAGWYFATREGIKVGPYRERFDAELDASLLIARLAQLEAGSNSRSEILRFLHAESCIRRQGYGSSERKAPPLRASGRPGWVSGLEQIVESLRLKRRARR